MKPSTTAALRAAAPGVELRLHDQLFDHTPDTAFFIKDAAGRYPAVNRPLLERHGLRDPSQMLGRRPSDVCPGDFGRIPSEQDAHVLRTGRPIIERLELEWYSPLQRTTPCVTAPASAAAFPPTMQVPRRTPRSLSLKGKGSILGRF